LVLAIVFVVMEAAGIDLQRVSLGALIIALGLLVDDAMITVESMVTRLEQGDDKETAASFAYTSTAFPMLTGTLVTVAGFVPIGFARSSAGEYTFSLFAVVAIALLTSWIVAVIFAPLFGVAILKRPAVVHAHGPGRLMRAFLAALRTAMRWRWATIGVTLALFAAAIFGMRFVPQQFFPSSDRPELLVDLKLPENASIYASDAVATRLDAKLKGDADVERWSVYVGRGAVRFYLPLNVQLPNDFFAQAVVVTKGVEARERVRKKLETALEEDFPGVVGRVYPLELGPAVGWPLQYRVSGPDPGAVREIAFRLAETAAKNPNARKINFDWIEPARTVRVKVDQDQARLLGVSSQALAQTLNAVVAGSTITQIRDDIYLVDVVLRAQGDERASLATFRSLQAPLAGGRSVPLSQLASFEYGQELPLIWRRDRTPTLTVQADVPPGVLPASVVAALAPDMAKLNASLPQGYRIETGGVAEESAKSQASVIVVAPVMLFLIFTILMIQLESFQRLFLVLSVAPLGLIGVVAALLISGKPLGFVAILGVLALTGMIARNSVILIDRIETEKAHGLSPWDATIEATSHRFRPILLTAAAAILGMIPIAPTVFWGPMAFAIMGGLAVATVLTLIFLPALYVAWFRVKEPAAAN
jgi:multidrug efflux pump subunit AcrB